MMEGQAKDCYIQTKGYGPVQQWLLPAVACSVGHQQLSSSSLSGSTHCWRFFRSGAGAFLRGGLRQDYMSEARPRTGPRQARRCLRAALLGSRLLLLLQGLIR